MSKKKKDKPQYYSLSKILSKNADYNMIIGERSNGKTYSALLYGLQKFVDSDYHDQMAIVRRYKEDVIGKRASSVFDAHVANGEIEKLTDGMYTGVAYQSGKWYLSYFDIELNKNIVYDKPFAYAFALTDVEHDKSIAYPDVTTIVFDEFLTRRQYLVDEFIVFMNVLSTIIRNRDNVKIFMLGNTVNKYCPYFAEMGLKHVAKMKQGSIDVYSYGNSKLKVAVEYCSTTDTKKKSNKYFAFDNANLQMITGGAWELALYPHLSVKYKPQDILFTYFIEFQGSILQCEIIQTDNDFFTYVHEKTTPIKNPDTDLIFSLEHSEKSNYRHRLIASTTKLQAKIAQFYALEKVFFQNNEVGEMVRNYILESSKSQFGR